MVLPVQQRKTHADAMPRSAEDISYRREEARKVNPHATKGQATHKGKQLAQEVRISQFGCDSSNVCITAWSDQLKKKISICVYTGTTRSILRKNLVEA